MSTTASRRLKLVYQMKGSWVAVVTPFDSNDNVDLGGFRTLVDFHAAHRTDGLVVMGSTGEATMLSVEEKKLIAREVCEYAKGKIPVFVGTTCSTTRETVEVSKYAQDAGADGILLIVPPYVRPPQDAIYEHFKTVAQAVSIPVALYNNPTRVGVNIDVQTVVKLAELDNVVADKEAMPNVQQIAEIKRQAGDKINVLCCDFPGYAIVIPTLALGGTGTANVTGNIAPEEFADMSKPWESYDDVVRSRELYFRLLPLMDAMYSLANPTPIKAALELLGLPAGKPRKPIPELTGERLRKLDELLTTMGIKEKYSVR